MDVYVFRFFGWKVLFGGINFFYKVGGKVI